MMNYSPPETITFPPGVRGFCPDCHQPIDAVSRRTVVAEILKLPISLLPPDLWTCEPCGHYFHRYEFNWYAATFPGADSFLVDIQ